MAVLYFPLRFIIIYSFKLISEGQLTRTKRYYYPSDLREKEMFCLPYSSEETIPIPRRDKRTYLEQTGLACRVSFSQETSHEEIEHMVRKKFAKYFDSPFQYTFLRYDNSLNSLSFAFHEKGPGNVRLLPGTCYRSLTIQTLILQIACISSDNTLFQNHFCKQSKFWDFPVYRKNFGLIVICGSYIAIACKSYLIHAAMEQITLARC